MREQDVVDALQRVERQVADAGAGVDQHVLVEQEAGGAAVARDRPGAAEDLDFHAGITRRVTRGGQRGSSCSWASSAARLASRWAASACSCCEAGRAASSSVSRA